MCEIKQPNQIDEISAGCSSNASDDFGPNESAVGTLTHLVDSRSRKPQTSDANVQEYVLQLVRQTGQMSGFVG